MLRLGQRNYREIDRPAETLAHSKVHTVNETIDKSVFDRCRRDPSYRPKNLVDWAARHNVDLDTIATSVQADDPSKVVPD